jgi:two-component SAPR family response regulator
MDQPVRLNGLRVLILEDEALLAMLLEDVLAEFGCSVAGTFSQNDAALAFLATNAADVDFGILDVNIGGQRSDPVAREFDRLGLPFVFSTGYDDSALNQTWRGKPSLKKPFRPIDLERILTDAAAARGT